MSRRLSGIDIWLSSGAALYWVSIAFRYMGASPWYASGTDAIGALCKYMFLVAWVFMTYLVMRTMGVRRSRRLLGTVAAGISALMAAMDLLATPTLQAPLDTAMLALDFFTVGVAMMLWGMAFTSIEKYLAAQNVIVTVIVATCLALIGEALSPLVPLRLQTDVLSTAATLIVAFGPVTIRNQMRDAVPERAARGRDARTPLAMAAYLAQRLAFGAALGFFPLAMREMTTVNLDAPLLTLSLLTLLACVVLSTCSRIPAYTVLPALLLVAFGALSVPSAFTGASGAVSALLAGIWLSWQALSSVQLSEVKERLWLSELHTTLLDKAAIAVSFLAGALLAIPLTGAGLAPSLLTRALLAVACLLVLMSTYVVARLVGVHQEDAVRDEITRLEDARSAEIYDGFARKYDLSPREREVVKMVAQGYSSAFIAGQLGVSQSTAKSHISHIYQKVGVHRKDELLELMDARGAS